MTAKTLMIQGTGSSVGKSVMVAALCRIFKQDGLRVAPFKSQNMSLNSFVTMDGGEMGRAQVVQAEAAGIEPTVDMNPILIKPEEDARAQIVVLGKPAFTLAAGEYYQHTPELLAVIEGALERLRSQYDLVVIEGAGSPAEINLKQTEIVNMRVAKMARSPVLLVGDIDKGGVFASLVGTLVLLDEEERQYIKGFIINKFRGDIALLKPGLDQLERITSRPVLGVVPYQHRLLIPDEDSIYQNESVRKKDVEIAVIYLPHISNSTDFEPLQQEDGVEVRYVSAVDELGEPDAIILPGTKSTIADLQYLWQTGLALEIVVRAKAGTPVIGICGGYQMLGKGIEDPQHVESQRDSIAGLGLLDMVTLFEPQKTTCQVKARVACEQGLLEGAKGMEVIGYEIHMGQSIGDDIAPAFEVTQIADRGVSYPDGATSGNILGTYLHGLFDSTDFRHTFLAQLHQRKRLPLLPRAPLPTKGEQFQKLAELVRGSLNMKLVCRICGLES
ncbi:MAG: cobyric acid synthase [Dehalococcoidia bacterium]|nr:cobyric acid synthase [Dehalococcoidia bacterium]